MPFAPHTRVSAIGFIGSSLERFSYGLSMESQLAGAGEMPSQGEAQDIANDFVAFHGRATSKIWQQAVLKEVKIAAIGADGKYTEDPIIISVNQVGGGGALPVPLPQAALVVSCESTRRGPTGKGRFYLPMPNVVITEPGFLMAVATAEDVRTSAQTLLGALNNEAGVDVVDRKVVIASSKGYNTPVTSIRVGRVIDTMRSRRKSLSESYTAEVAVSGS
jgi:hypothetical protein